MLKDFISLFKRKENKNVLPDSLLCSGHGNCDGFPCQSAARDAINEPICRKSCDK